MIALGWMSGSLSCGPGAELAFLFHSVLLLLIGGMYLAGVFIRVLGSLQKFFDLLVWLSIAWIRWDGRLASLYRVILYISDWHRMDGWHSLLWGRESSLLFALYAMDWDR